MNGSSKSKRFQPSKWVERFVPVLLILLLLGLLATIVIVVLAMAGILSVV